MKIIKNLLLLLLVIIGLALIAAAFLPKPYSVAESVTIKAPLAKVADYFKLLKNTEQYSAWVLDDPKSQRSYSGTDGTVGATQSWQGGEFGKGSQTIKTIEPNKLEMELNFLEPMASQALAAYTYKMIDSNTTEITSTFSGNSKWPFNLLNSYSSKMIKEAEIKSLKNAAKILEAK
jgi:hypothetical protein